MTNARPIKFRHALGTLSLFAMIAMASPTSHESEVMTALSGSTEGTPGFPARSDYAISGSEFLRSTEGMGAVERERAILAEIESGNVPDHLRELVPVQVDYENHEATVYVIPDYLAIGSDDDYVIIPMTPRTAMHIANEFGFTLPTRKLVDDIYQHSNVQLDPQPMRPGPAMTSNAYYQRHDEQIKTQMPEPLAPHSLVAGHKKDVVLTPRLQQQPERVAIYGWHRDSGHPIQPLSLVHEIDYVDYSHGVRLVSRQAIVDGEAVDLSQLYSDPDLVPLVSDEGRIPLQSYL